MIYNLLFDWQKKIVDKYKDRNSFGLFLDMGLGKTPISLAFTEVNNCSKLLIITINSKAEEPKSLKDSWLGWLQNSNIKYNEHTKKTKSNFDINQNDVLLINYESLFSRSKDIRVSCQLKDKVLEFIKSCKGHNVGMIIDECHKMKNLQSLQTKAIFQIKRLLENKVNNLYIYLLSGTPFTTGYIDLYTQLKMLGCAMTKSQFVDDFCVRGDIPGLLGWQQPIIGYKNLDKLYNLIHKFAITIKSEEVINLPEQIFINHPTIESKDFYLLTNEYIKGTEIYDEMITRNESRIDIDKYNNKSKMNNPFFRNIDFPDMKWLADTNGTFWLRAREISIGFQGKGDDYKFYNHNRFEKIKQFLSEHQDNYVIFYNYTPELYELYEICEELGYNIDVYCGEIKSLHFYERFCEMDEGKKLVNKNNIIISNFASGSTGMNWQQYNKVIITSIPLYKDYAQGIKRVHRTGQKNTVIYHLFYENNWLDLGMKKALEKAEDYSQKMFDTDLERVRGILNDSREESSK